MRKLWSWERKQVVCELFCWSENNFFSTSTISLFARGTKTFSSTAFPASSSYSSTTFSHPRHHHHQLSYRPLARASVDVLKTTKVFKLNRVLTCKLYRFPDDLWETLKNWTFGCCKELFVFVRLRDRRPKERCGIEHGKWRANFLVARNKLRNEEQVNKQRTKKIKRIKKLLIIIKVESEQRVT